MLILHRECIKGEQCRVFANSQKLSRNLHRSSMSHVVLQLINYPMRRTGFCTITYARSLLPESPKSLSLTIRATHCNCETWLLYGLVFITGLRNVGKFRRRKFSRRINSQTELIGDRADRESNSYGIIKMAVAPMEVAPARRGGQRIIQSKRTVKPLTSAVKYAQHHCGDAGRRHASLVKLVYWR